MPYELADKRKAITFGYHQKQKQINKYFFKHQISIERQITIKKLFSQKYISWNLCEAVNNGRYQRSKRIRARLNKFITLGQAYLITLTFTDDVLKSTSHDTRRRYVARHLSSHYQYYFANVDYGKTTEREHYHAVVDCSVLGVIPDKSWEYGFSDIKKVRLNQDSINAIPKYTSKLTNHALKASGQMERIIYSRKK